ncbi:recombinase family protein [Bacillus sonorensis]|uniref:Recombinase family protein n=1 Tax=Bacillus sonorensis TaxID=119858 RepID=A0ABN5AH25_9BACI|nr:recombinase family protein [Bacillus sonorensis]ASB88384.1 hypothetical protein S101395_01876 [Bacillus sonorensis]MCY8269630.1 recombinase family protein [Bacillus sonorensis]MCY8607256.1 recombinase family protein [Bacillus sonorensis]
MRAAIYIRVSTKLQEEKYSLRAQTTELNRYVEQQGWRLVDEFQDIESGGKLHKKGLNALLDIVEEGKIDVVVCIDQDRLSRLDTIAWEYLKSTLRENKVKIAEPGTIVDLDDEDQEFVSDIKNLIAKREKKSFVKRMMRGKRQRMREGKGWGQAPYEYYYDKKEEQYKLKKEWAWVIPFIDRLYLEEQLGMSSIADQLNKISKTPSGIMWNEHLVHTRLTTKAYHGVQEKAFANGEVIAAENIYPKLRTKETWEKIQIERNKRGNQYKVTSRKRNDLHLLRRTYFVCGECGRKIHLAAHGTKEAPRYYLKHGRKLRLADGSVCDVSINTVRIEGNIVQAIKDIVTSKELAKQYVNLENEKEEIIQLEQNIKNNEQTIQKHTTKIEKLIDLYLDNHLTKDQLNKKQIEIKNITENLQSQLKRDKAKLETLKSDSWSYDFLSELFESINFFDSDFSPLERAMLMGNIFPEGIVYRDHIILKANIGGLNFDVKVLVDEDPFPWHYSKRSKEQK